MFPVNASVTLTNADQLQAFNNFVLGTMLGTAKAIEAPKQEVKKADPKPEAPAAASAAQPAATEKATPAPTAAASGGDATIDKAKALTMKIVADKGRDSAVKLLTKYGVPVAAKLPADQVAAFCTDAEAVLAS